MIWDLHVHVSGNNIEGRTYDERIVNVIRYGDRMQIDRFILYLGWPYASDVNPKPEEFRRQNDQVINALTHWHHRAFGLAYVNPNYPEESVKEIDRCIKDGPLMGIKLWVAGKCSDPAIDPIIKRCAELKGIIYQHTWHKTQGDGPRESTPEDMAILAARHPTVPLILGHSGGNWEWGIRTVRGLKNVWLDLAGSDPVSGFVEMGVREVGADRIIYGSDVGGRSFASQLSKVQGADIPETSKQLILGRNLQRMMEPILTAKGVKP
jgi:predicted TIM-barrel fold metal-dependent hydrolase